MRPENNRNFSPKISIKTFTHDYYMLELPSNRENQFYKEFPYYAQEKDFKGQLIKVAPVARIYGTNEFGQKCCCHVHGYFPSFYIKALDYTQAFDNEPEFVNHFLQTLENLYQRAYQINKPIILKGFPQYKYDFYGYHENQECFLKIVLYDPAYIIKMRELLDSKILCNRSFQCYEAHINYFMQMFSDQNIYGINEMLIYGYTFRKNMKNEIMDLFKKIDIQDRQLNPAGWDLITIEKQYPQSFNSLHKVSSCYVQIDFHINAILNSYESEFEEEDLRSSDEEDFIDQPNKRKFKVQITKALQEIWADEKRRRSHYGIKEKPKGQINFTQNIEAHYSVYQKDPLWINFLPKSNIAEKFIDMIRSSIAAKEPAQNRDLFITRQIAENYNNVIFQEKQKLIEKVKQRWKYYGNRKVNILNQLLEGNRDQLPQWQDDVLSQSGSSSSFNDSDRQADDRSVIGQEKEDGKTRKMGNTLLYRANFKHVKATLKKGSYFYVCQYCRKIQKNCECKLIIEQCQKIKTGQNRCLFEYSLAGPSKEQCLATIQYENQKPFYSNFNDLFNYYNINSQFEVCLKNAQFLEKQLKILKNYDRPPIGIKNSLKLPYFYTIDQIPDNTHSFTPKTYFLEFSKDPPSKDQIIHEINPIQKQSARQTIRPHRSTSIGALKNPSFISDLLVIHYQLICEMRDEKLFYANPQKDPIICLVYDISNFKRYDYRAKGMILVDKFYTPFDMTQLDDLFIVKDQFALLTIFINIIFRIDPDLLITYDQEKKGIRYLTQRGFACGINMQELLSRCCDLEQLFGFINFRDFRMPKQTILTRKILLSGNLLQNKRKHMYSPQLKFLEQKMKRSLKRKPILRKNYRFDIDIKGRVNLNIYRICESDLKLKSYTMEAVTKHLFNEQLCEFSDNQLFKWFKQSPNKKSDFVLEYLQTRLTIQSRIIISLNILSVVIEKSKIFGADFISMMERGSQFKIETVMCRVTKKSGYLTLSASKNQVANQSILQCWPLVIEPPKQFFSDPVLLFDFQSLYPSVMIAYNLCYSTCLGSVNNLFDENKNKRFGVCEKTNIDVKWLEEIIQKCQKENLSQMLENYIFITPNKVAFVKKNVKQGIIPRILLEFLISRIMIKDSSKLYSKEKVKALLKNRQIALKLFMNVMFGYTGASFSGRMPCSEIADSVVEVAKYSLRQIIDFLNNHPKFKGKVLYGDTDSVFFHLPGYNIKEAIKIGNQLTTEMTSMFPYPMQMKFEKAYDGLFLVSKKRYYGKSYETEKSAPKYEGKGLQCVRRDGIQLTSNLMQTLLNNLIDLKDISTIKQIFLKQCGLVLGGQKLEDQFALAKQVKMAKYSEKHIPAHGEAARRLQKIDPMLIPKYGERMKYVVIEGGLKPIKYRSFSIFQYAHSSKSMKLDYGYYLNKQIIPPLQRVFSSLVNLKEWHIKSNQNHKPLGNQSLNFNKRCIKCCGEAYFIVCEKCFGYIDQQLEKLEKVAQESKVQCRVCVNNPQVNIEACVEWNCKQLWERRRKGQQYNKRKPQLQKLKIGVKQLGF